MGKRRQSGSERSAQGLHHGGRALRGAGQALSSRALASVASTLALTAVSRQRARTPRPRYRRPPAPSSVCSASTAPTRRTMATRWGMARSPPRWSAEPFGLVVVVKRQDPQPWWGLGVLVMVVRRCPTLPHPPGCSTIGAVGLSFRVRNGTGRFPHAMTAVTLAPPTRGVGEIFVVLQLWCCIQLCLVSCNP